MTLEDAIANKPACVGDREPIRLQFTQDKMGIAAALRQAFTAAAHDKSDHDFEQLLSELH
jgi:hypothetical protein